MKTAEQVMTEIAETAKTSSPVLRMVEALVPGTAERQGDLYVLHLGPPTSTANKVSAQLETIRKKAKKDETTLKSLPKTRGEKTNSRQLATGYTQGSRHVAVGELEVYAPVAEAGPLVGPIVVAQERWKLEHPEHGHVSLPAGNFQILYQRDYRRELEEVRRVSD